uniref:Uncharacterized protein n=1 Tax=Oryza punctata TaxID=4537 RepID=A0A0E0KAU6_ORYPU
MAGHRNKDVPFVSWGEFARGLFFLAPGSPPIVSRCPLICDYIVQQSRVNLDMELQRKNQVNEVKLCKCEKPHGQW